METIYTKENATHKLEIWQDNYPESPRDWDNAGSVFVTWMKNYCSPDENMWDSERDFLLSLADEIHEWFSEYYNYYETDDKRGDANLEAILDKHYLILAVYAYSHGQTLYSCSPFSCPWDSGQAGYIVLSREVITKEWGGDEEKARDFLCAQVEEYSQWANGDVYGFTLHEKETCDCCGNIDYEIKDSCGGFYGQDWKNNGMKDCLDPEFHELLP